MEGLSQPALLDVAPKRRKSSLLFNPKEFKILSLRECPTPAEMQLCDTPDNAAAYWREHVPGTRISTGTWNASLCSCSTPGAGSRGTA